ncbi:Uncharacterised protein [Streptococcus pneumoniae]|nr:Uncharacterised protein [Streptococcus pneumoniae]
MILEKLLKKSKVLGWRISYTKIQVLLNAMMIALQKLNVAMIVIAQEQDVLV